MKPLRPETLFHDVGRISASRLSVPLDVKDFLWALNFFKGLWTMGPYLVYYNGTIRAL